MTACPLCRRPAETPHDRCRTDLDQRLRDMPGLYVLLGTALEPGRTAGARVSGTRTPPLPARLAALNLRGPGGIITILAAWENDWRIERTFTPAARVLTATDLAKIVNFLRDNLDWAIRAYPQIDTFADAVYAITSNCHQAIGLGSGLMLIGHCPNVDDDGYPCHHPLTIDPHSTPPATSIRCPACRTDWPRPRWALLGKILSGTDEDANDDDQENHAA